MLLAWTTAAIGKTMRAASRPWRAPDAIYRYQTRGDIRRCDGKPAYLFAEKFDGTRFR